MLSPTMGNGRGLAVLNKILYGLWRDVEYVPGHTGTQHMRMQSLQ